MNKPQTLQELRDFFASIPEDHWCKGTRHRYKGEIHQYCAVGHLVQRFWDAEAILVPLRINMLELIQHNDNWHEGPKAGALLYIDKHLQA